MRGRNAPQNVNNLCPHFHEAFQNSRLAFGTGVECNVLYHKALVLDRDNLKQFLRCKFAQEVTLDGSSLDASVTFPKLEVGSLVLNDFKDDAHFPALKSISGRLQITGVSKLADLFVNVSVGELVLSGASEIDSIVFGNVKVENKLLIENSSVQMVSGISSRPSPTSPWPTTPPCGSSTFPD